jgi:hypothetical protein
MAKWGIGGQDLWLQDGEVWSGNRRCFIVDAQTAVAVDLPRKLGARDGMLLDGGSSSSMAIGTGASVVSSGAVHGWRPVARQFGIRAEPLRDTC